MAVYPNGLKTPPTVTDGFGPRVNPVTGIQGMHFGVDSVGHPSGLNYAPEGGTVFFASSNFGAGLEVRIKVSGTNREWRLKHHASFKVAAGQSIGQGAPTGPTGTTGQSTGVHCHTELLIGGVKVDPFKWIAANLSPKKVEKEKMTTNFVDTSTFVAGKPVKGTICATGGEGGENWFEYPRTLVAGELAAQLSARHGGHVTLTGPEFAAMRDTYKAQPSFTIPPVTVAIDYDAMAKANAKAILDEQSARLAN